MYLKPGMIAFLVACNCGKKEEVEDTAAAEDSAVEESEDSGSDTSVELPEDTAESIEDSGSDTAEEGE
tara:strand:+ start:112 stop:315 length:204 start_codon:yes stop_codon:yes gene_type:complete